MFKKHHVLLLRLILLDGLKTMSIVDLANEQMIRLAIRKAANIFWNRSSEVDVPAMVLVTRESYIASRETQFGIRGWKFGFAVSPRVPGPPLGP